MEKDYVENLKAVAGVGGNKISEQNLVLLKEKYNLTEEGMKEMKAYCNTHRILIYDEIAKGEFAEDMNDVQEKNNMRLLEDLKRRYWEAPDLISVGKNGYRFVNAVSDFATHAPPSARPRTIMKTSSCEPLRKIL